MFEAFLGQFVLGQELVEVIIFDSKSTFAVFTPLAFITVVLGNVHGIPEVVLFTVPLL
jgi:hypothetical protein